MSLMHDYTLLTSENEACQTFHRWSAISLLSHVIGRRIWLDWGIVGTVYPNLYVVLVGSPGSKKSTAMRIARSFVDKMGCIPLAGDSQTKESICKQMALVDGECQQSFNFEGKVKNYSQLSVFANELVNLINSGGNAIGMVDFFTDIWDTNRFRVNTKNKGNDDIINPYVSILGCLTPSTIKLLISQRVVSGGMVRRCIFVHSDKPGAPNARPTITPEMEAASKRIMDHLIALRSLSGPMLWTPESEACFDEFYNENHFRKASILDESLAGFLETKAELVLKIAMLVQLTKQPFDMKLSVESMKVAIAMVTSVEHGASKLFSGIGRNELSPVAEQIKNLVDTSDEPINRKTIYSLFFKDASIEEINQMLEFYESQGVLFKEIVEVTSGSVKSKITYISTREKLDSFLKQLPKARKDSTE